jgi:hypothetical protein
MSKENQKWLFVFLGLVVIFAVVSGLLRLRGQDDSGVPVKTGSLVYSDIVIL